MRRLAQAAPYPWPARVTLLASPPNSPMFSWTQWRAATWSMSPKFPLEAPPSKAGRNPVVIMTKWKHDWVSEGNIWITIMTAWLPSWECLSNERVEWHQSLITPLIIVRGHRSQHHQHLSFTDDDHHHLRLVLSAVVLLAIIFSSHYEKRTDLLWETDNIKGSRRKWWRLQEKRMLMIMRQLSLLKGIF